MCLFHHICWLRYHIRYARVNYFELQTYLLSQLKDTDGFRTVEHRSHNFTAFRLRTRGPWPLSNLEKPKTHIQTLQGMDFSTYHLLRSFEEGATADDKQNLFTSKLGHKKAHAVCSEVQVNSGSAYDLSHWYSD